MGASAERLRRIVESLCTKEAFDHPVGRFEIIETHISYVLLTGRYAYKLKKPLNLGFLDYTSLEKRKFYCEEELRLNRRLAPGLYLAVAPITGDESAPRVGEGGLAIEYCVKMRQFPREQGLDRLIERGELCGSHMDPAAAEIARFHAQAAIAPGESLYGTAGLVAGYSLGNFELIGAGPAGCETRAALEALRGYTRERIERHADLFEARRAAGRVRECHGDLHLSNMVLLDGEIMVFDCIEFNPELIWIDVVSEVAFLAMDLDARRRPDLSARFLNRYFEHCGDYAGIALLDFYRVYRSLVRAKVAYLQTLHAEGAKLSESRARYVRHVGLAGRYASRSSPGPIVITHGLSGSGKTWFSERLIETTGAVRIRSDIERKRLAGLAPLSRPGGTAQSEMYSAEHSARTYAHLRGLARMIAGAGFPVIVDAAFLCIAERAAFCTLADEICSRFAILDLVAPEAILQDRIGHRLADGRDASDADRTVLEFQIRTREPLSAREREISVTVDTGTDPDLPELAHRLGLSAHAVVAADPSAPTSEQAGDGGLPSK